MAVYDRWHKGGPGEPCRQHKMVPSAVHGTGKRWQVRWYDDNGDQRKQNFALKTGPNPGLHADAFDAKVSRDVDTGDYIDRSRADITLQEYAEDWRKGRGHDTVTAGKLEARLRLHVYQDPAAPGKTPRGGVAIGQRRMAELARRPSLVQAWITAIPLAESSARLVVTDVSAVFAAAAADGIVGLDPTRSSVVTRPGRGGRKARPWPAERVAAMAAELPARYEVIPWLGAGSGMRQGEIFGLAVDDITFLGRDPRISVQRQVKLIGSTPHFAPVKNRKPHTVPLAASLAPRLARHLGLYPAVEVTLPWHDPRDKRRHGRPVTLRLVLTDGKGGALHRMRFGELWCAARVRAGITPEPGEEGLKSADGMHALRHTAASAWLRKRVDVVRVAAWLGDTPAVVWASYAHLVPGDSGDDGRAAIDEFFSSGAPDMPSGLAGELLCEVSAPGFHFRWK